MSRCRRPVLNPLPPNALRSFDKFVARAFPVLDYNDMISAIVSFRQQKIVGLAEEFGVTFVIGRGWYRIAGAGESS